MNFITSVQLLSRTRAGMSSNFYDSKSFSLANQFSRDGSGAAGQNGPPPQLGTDADLI